MLEVPFPDVLSLVAGESVVAFVERGTVTEGDEAVLAAVGRRDATAVKPAYRRWTEETLPDGEWLAVVVAVHPAAALDPDAGSARHVLATTPDGDVAIVRVYENANPVLSDAAFEARRRSVEGAITE